MYINPFVAGIITTILCEIIALIIWGILKYGKGGGNKP